MGSQSFTNQEDKRTALEGDTDLFMSPEAQYVNPLGIALTSSMASATNANISYGDVSIHEYPEELNTLVEMILADSQKDVAAAAETTDSLADVVEGVKTPLSQYIPYAVIAAVLIVALIFRKK